MITESSMGNDESRAYAKGMVRAKRFKAAYEKRFGPMSKNLVDFMCNFTEMEMQQAYETCEGSLGAMAESDYWFLQAEGWGGD